MPNTPKVAKLFKLINTYVWHGLFDELEGKLFTWLNESVEVVSCKEGRLYISNLKAELLALAAVTV